MYNLNQLYHIQNAAGFIQIVKGKLSSSIPSPFSNHSPAKLNGHVEGNEFYIKAGLKGKSYCSEIIVKLGRKPRKKLEPLER
jgi:hypothetical protein